MYQDHIKLRYQKVNKGPEERKNYNPNLNWSDNIIKENESLIW